MNVKRFQRTQENFTCEKCGVFVCGNGYTNHCPQCLYSKHVDINPGDRKATCGGLMEPEEVLSKAGGFIILHRCMLCGYEKPNKTAINDNLDVALIT